MEIPSDTIIEKNWEFLSDYQWRRKGVFCDLCRGRLPPLHSLPGYRVLTPRLMAASPLGSLATVVAKEPHPSEIESLREGLREADLSWRKRMGIEPT